MALANMTQAETDRENREHCKRIAEDLEAYANGDLYRCPECQEVFQLYDPHGENHWFDEEENEIGKCPHCGHTSTNENDFEPLGLWDYMSDALDFRFLVNSNNEIIATKILVAFGGPNIWIDTETRAVELYWWTDRASYPISRDVAAAIDEWAEEYRGCM